MEKFKDKMLIILGRGLSMFMFFLLMFSLMRLIFIISLSEYMTEVARTDEWKALWYGLRLSCQTAGILTLIILLPNVFSRRVTNIFAFIVFLLTSVLYVASFPFYQQFHSNFNQMIFTAVHEDYYALLVTLIESFDLPLRMFVAIMLSLVLYKIFMKVQKIKAEDFLGRRVQTKIFSFLKILAFYFSVTLTIYGGGLSWQTELNFENVGVTKDKFLNEAILDSYQAIHRGYVLQNRILSSKGLNFTTEDVINLAAWHANMSPTSDDLNYYLRRQAKGALISKPQQIFVIISESYANWPLLEKYSELHIADGAKSIIAAEDSDYCPTFLPNGANTVSAVTGIVTNFADANLYLTTLPQSFDRVYSTSAAPQMKHLGYATNFFYAGPATWERIGEFTIAQGFDNFYSQGDITANATGNVWGVDDKFLYQFIAERLDWTTPSFNVILNTSNHAPYTVDLNSEQINLAVSFDDETLNRKLAHHFYADRELKKFVDLVKSKSPESLIIIIGDHADRCNIDRQPSDYERFAVPFIITGNEVKHGMLAANAAGSHIDVVPTIIELIAPKGFEYYAVGTSLTENDIGVNYALFITRQMIGNANVSPLNPEPLTKNVTITNLNADKLNTMENYINYVRGVSSMSVLNNKKAANH